MTDAQNDREGETPADDAAQATPSETVTSETVRVRRTPRYARFMLVGVIVCVVAAFILTYSFPQGAGYDRNTVFGFMLLVAIAVGVVLGALAALIADRVARRRARTVTVDRIDVRMSRDDASSTPHDAG
jgi:H+/Cl- antiporter ClcA